MRDVTLYGLVSPDNEIRYIGVTRVSLKNRLSGHLKDKRKSHKRDWIQSVLKSGGKIHIIDLLKMGESDWATKERYWIWALRANGYHLTNTAEGGVGPGVHSEETRALISRRVREAKASPERVALRKTPEYRALMSSYGKKSCSRVKRPNPWNNPEFRAKSLLAFKKAQSDPERIKKNSEAMKRRWLEPEDRMRFMAGANAVKKTYTRRKLGPRSRLRPALIFDPTTGLNHITDASELI